MAAMRCRSRFDPEKIKRKVNQGTFKSLSHAAAAIRLTARRSIRRSARKSLSGTPPHTRCGLLKRALLYKVEKTKLSAVIGPAYSISGRSGRAHEFGGKYYGRDYPQRSFMGPALQANLKRVPKFWLHTVKQ